MHTHQFLPLLSALPLSRAAETVLGLYIFSRHGDRTAKTTPPANLTDLGYKEVFDSGTWFREQYVSSSAPRKIAGLNTDLVKLSQLAVSAPLDNVLVSSAQGFLQGLYPPVGSTLGSGTLRNGTVVQTPLDGYQIVPVQTVTSGVGSEDSAWLQGAGNCANAIVSSNNYYQSLQYMSFLNRTRDFYTSIAPTVNATFTPDQINFENAYTSQSTLSHLPLFNPPNTHHHLVFDLLNVASIHNASFPSSDLITNSTLDQLRTLADTHEYNLAFNSSEPIRAISGATLGAQILQALNNTVATKGKLPLNIQFGAYGSFQSLFGLANLTATNPDFFGIPDYASSMTFELFTTAAPTPFPGPNDLSVRFLFHNGTTGNISTPIAYPLFGSPNVEMSWTAFVAGMNAFAVGGQSQWCSACGNTTGVCAVQGASSGPGAAAGESGGGMSNAVAGVIGAFVTLAVVLLVEAVVMLVAGLRLVGKNRLRAAGATAAEK